MYVKYIKLKNKLSGFVSSRIDKYILNAKIQPQELKINLDTKCLVIASNPMDECLGLGGLMLAYPKNFEILTMCAGYSDEEYKSSVNSKIVVANEFKTAMELLRPAGYKNFDINAGELHLNKKIFEKINIADTDYLFLPNFFSTNPDDMVIVKSMADILRDTECERDLKIILFEVNSAILKPNFFFDISKRVKIKEEILSAYKTRNSYKNWYEIIISLNRFRGFQTNATYAEAFTVLDVEDFLNLI